MALTREQLYEQLAWHEHASWARWMQYLFSQCTKLPDGGYYIPAAFAARWKDQSQASYDALTEREKDSDRKEVDHIMPLIDEYAISYIPAPIRRAPKAGAQDLFP